MVRAGPALRGIAVSVLVALISTLLVTIALELLLRGTNLGNAGCSYAQRHPVLGFEHIPGKMVVCSHEGYSVYRVNAQGQVDDDFPMMQESVGFRVAVLGDSFAEGFGVMPSVRFSSLLRRDLGIEVLNFGVSAYSTGIQLLQWRHKVSDYEPDIVILGLYEGNDFRENYHEVLGSTHPGIEPYFLLENGKPRLTNSEQVRAQYQKVISTPSGRVKRWARANLYLWTLSSKAVQPFRSIVSALSLDDVQVSGYDVGDESGVQEKRGCSEDGGDYLQMWADGPGSACHPRFSEAVELTEALLLTLRNEIEEQGGHFVWFSIPRCDSMMTYLNSNDLVHHPSLTEELRNFAVQNNMLHFALLESFVEHHDPRQLYIQCPGHFSERGHQVVSGILQDFLVQEGLVPD